MSAKGPKAELAKLKKFVGEVESQFVASHLVPKALGPPSAEENLNVAAYVVLVHGALENFIEGISLWALGKIDEGWTHKSRVSQCTASLMLHYATYTEDEEPSTVFDSIRAAIGHAKQNLSAKIEGNNGVTLRHVRQLLKPIGVDVPQDAALVASLEKLISMRHLWVPSDNYISPPTTIRSPHPGRR